MTTGRTFLSRYAELIFIVLLVVATAFTILIAADKLSFLSFYQIPVLVAAYFLGRRQGVMVACAAVLMVGIYAAIDPAVFVPSAEWQPAMAVFIWGAFTIVTAYVVGTLYEVKTAAIADLQRAYEGVLDILSELIDTVGHYANNHSVRVADLAAKTAVVLDLPNQQIEDIRVAGLLHDITKVDLSIDVLRKAADQALAPIPTQPGVRAARRAIGDTGGLLRDVIPLIEAHHEHFDGRGELGLSGDDIPIGARVLAVADALDKLIAREPYGEELNLAEALFRLEDQAGSVLDPKVVEAVTVVAETSASRFLVEPGGGLVGPPAGVASQLA
jgi:hypothetical protein